MYLTFEYVENTYEHMYVFRTSRVKIPEKWGKAKMEAFLWWKFVTKYEKPFLETASNTKLLIVSAPSKPRRVKPPVQTFQKRIKKSTSPLTLYGGGCIFWLAAGMEKEWKNTRHQREIFQIFARLPRAQKNYTKQWMKLNFKLKSTTFKRVGPRGFFF